MAIQQGSYMARLYRIAVGEGVRKSRAPFAASEPLHDGLRFAARNGAGVLVCSPGFYLEGARP
jgi:hypothetical protein